MVGQRMRQGSLGTALLSLLAMLIAFPAVPASASEAPPTELRHVCIDAQKNVLYAEGPAACERRETLRTLPDDRPARWCADHLGRLKESAGCSSRERPITVPDDGPVFVCARNIVGGTTEPRGALRTVADISECDQDETGLVTPAAPEGVADTYTIDEDTLLVVPDKGVLDNDIDLTGAPLTADLVETATQGSLDFDASGGFRFDPRGVFDQLDAGQSATTSFRYLADDGALASEPTTVTVRVEGRNDRPRADDDVFVTDEDTMLQVSAAGVLANDTDAEGHPLASVPVSEPDRGVLALGPDGGLRFEPRGDFQHLGATPGETETVTFHYVARDGSTDSDEATVSLRVVGINDKPVGTPDSFATDENTAVEIDPATLVANDTDAEGQTLTATGVALADAGVGTLTPLPDGRLRYDPNADSDDPDGAPDLDHLQAGQTETVRLTYRATDDGGLGSAPVPVTISVRGLSAPTANDDLRATDEDRAIALDVLANDQVRGGTLSLDATGTDGRVTVEHDGVVRYDPSGAFDQLPAGAAASDSFRYTLTNGEGTSTGTVSVQVAGVNDAPVAHDDSHTVAPGSVLQVPSPGVLGNDEDDDNALADLDAVLVAPPDRGRLTLHPGGGFDFDPSGDFPGGGATTFSYRADDGSAESATAKVTLQVVSNVPPSFDDEPYEFTAVATDSAGSVVGRLAAHDGDGDPLEYVVVDADTPAFRLDPDSGALTIGAGGPPAVGEYTLLVDVRDGRGGSDRTTVTVRVVPELNAADDHYVAVGNTRLVGSAPAAATPTSEQAVVHVEGVLANDGGSTGRVVPRTGLATTRGGSVDLAADGSFVYTPPPALPGTAGAWDGTSPLTDSFDYAIEGEGVDDPIGAVTIDVLDAVWYVDNRAAAGGSGTAWSPFDSLSHVSGSGPDRDLPGQTVFLFGHPDDPDTAVDESAYPGGVLLENGQALVGHGAGLTIDEGADELVVIAAGPTPRVDGATGGHAIGLAADNRLRGLTVGGAGAGIVGTAVGSLSAAVPAVTTAGTPLHLGGSDPVEVRIDAITATGSSAGIVLDGVGGTVTLGTVDRDAAAGRLPILISGTTEFVGIASADLGDASLTVVDNGADRKVVVGTLTGNGPRAGLEVRGNRGEVSVASLDLGNVSGTGVQLVDDDGTTAVGGGRVSGTPTETDALVSVSGGSAGTIQLDATVTATSSGSAECHAVSISGVAAGGAVDVTGRVVGQGCGIDVDGSTQAVAGGVRFLGGMDVRTQAAAAFTATDVAAPGHLEVLPSPAGSVLAATDSAVLVLRNVHVGADGMRFNRTDATHSPTLATPTTGIEITDVSGEPGPGLVLNGGTVMTPGLAGATVTDSSLVTLRGVRVDRSAGEGIVVSGSRQITLNGVQVQRPDGIGLAASGTGDLVVDGATVSAAGSYGIQLTDLAGRTTLRGSSVVDSRDTQLRVTDGATPAGATDEVVVQSTVFSGAEAEDDSIEVRAGHDSGAPTPANLRFEVSGTTPAGSIGGDTGLAATAAGGADLHVALSRFAVADTAGDAIAMHAEGTGSALSFGLTTINTSAGGGIQLAGGAGIRVDATGGAAAQGSMHEVAVSTTKQSGVVLRGVSDVALSMVDVQGAERHGFEITGSSDVTLDQVEVIRPTEHGLLAVGTTDLVVDDSRFDLRPPRPVSATAHPSTMPSFSGIRIEQPGGIANAVTDTTLRGSTGDQLSVRNGVGALELAGLTVLDTAVDPVVGRSSSTTLPVPDADAVSVFAGSDADLDVEFSGNLSTVDETVLLRAVGGGSLTVSGAPHIEHVSGDSPEERETSTPDPTLAFEATDTGSTLDLSFADLQLTQVPPGADVPPPGTALLVRALDEGEVTDLTVSDGQIHAAAAAASPAVRVYATSTQPPATFPPTPPPPMGIIDGILVEKVTVLSGSGDGMAMENVGCVDLKQNTTTAVAGTGYVLSDVSLVDFAQYPDVTAWLTAKANAGPPDGRLVSSSDVFPGECA